VTLSPLRPERALGYFKPWSSETGTERTLDSFAASVPMAQQVSSFLGEKGGHFVETQCTQTQLCDAVMDIHFFIECTHVFILFQHSCNISQSKCCGTGNVFRNVFITFLICQKGKECDDVLRISSPLMYNDC